MLVGVASLPPSFPPFGIQVFYSRKRHNCEYFCNTLYMQLKLLPKSIRIFFSNIILCELYVCKVLKIYIKLISEKQIQYSFMIFRFSYEIWVKKQICNSVPLKVIVFMLHVELFFETFLRFELVLVRWVFQNYGFCEYYDLHR